MPVHETNANAAIMALVPSNRASSSRAVDPDDEWGPVDLQSGSDGAPRRKRGRPPGLYGCKELRARLRQEREDCQQLQAVQDLQDVPSPSHDKQTLTVQLRLPGILSQFVNVGSTLQKQVAMFLHEQTQQPAEPDVDDTAANNPAVEHLFCGRRPISTLSSMRFLTEFDDQRLATTAVEKKRVAATVLEGAGYLWGAFFQKLSDMLERGCIGLWFGVSRRYDETPYKIRIHEDAAALPSQAETQQGKQTGLAVKVLQSEMAFHVLFYRPSSQQHLLLHGRLPMHLQCMDAVTGEVTRACQLELESLVPNLDAVASQFAVRSCFPCTDRATGNIACEESLRAERPEWTWAHTFCEVHQCSGCQKHTLQLCQGHLSGLTACAVAMQQAGVTAALRKHLAAIIDEWLQVCVGPARGEEHRTAVYDLYLHETLCTQLSPFQKRKHRSSLKPESGGSYWRGC